VFIKYLSRVMEGRMEEGRKGTCAAWVN